MNQKIRNTAKTTILMFSTRETFFAMSAHKYPCHMKTNFYFLYREAYVLY